MRDTMSVREAAGLWNLTERRVSGLCRDISGLFLLMHKNRRIIV